MRKFILLLLVVNFHLVAYNQVIKGIVLDSQTKGTIYFASVYFNGTFVGTHSDTDGNFELDISKNTSIPLTISAIGYYSVTLTDLSTDKPLIISLEPKLYDLKEVVVSAKSLVRKRKADLKIFRNEFLGTTANAQNCEIMNENDITFNYDSDRDTLKAFTSKPILINNRALGYKITYYLDKFEYYKKSNNISFIGNIIFNKDTTIEETKKKFYEKRRKETYRGSRMHFFRALWTEDLELSGFEVRNSDNQHLYPKDIVIQENNCPRDSLNNHKKFLKYSENMRIIYFSGSSIIYFLNEKVYFDKDGYFDQSSIKWQGEMAKQRVANWLPFEYRIK